MTVAQSASVEGLEAFRLGLTPPDVARERAELAIPALIGCAQRGSDEHRPDPIAVISGADVCAIFGARLLDQDTFDAGWAELTTLVKDHADPDAINQAARHLLGIA